MFFNIPDVSLSLFHHLRVSENAEVMFRWVHSFFLQNVNRKGKLPKNFQRFRGVRFGKWKDHAIVAKSQVKGKPQCHYSALKQNRAKGNLERSVIFLLKITVSTLEW